MADSVEEQLEPSGVGGAGPGPHEGTVTVEATHNWRKRALIAAVISLLASGAMAAASFMPWLSSGGGRTLSGWDIYEAQRDAGHNVFFISRFFTDPDGRSVAFFTGRATLLSGLGLAGVTVVFLILNIMLRQRQSRKGSQAPGRAALSVRLVAVLQVLVAIAAIAAPMVNARFYFEGGQASGASLEYGLILLWAATYVGFLGNVLGYATAWDRENLRGRDYLAYLMGAVLVAIGLAAGNLLPMS